MSAKPLNNDGIEKPLNATNLTTLFRTRMLPLTLLLFFSVALSAPTAFYGIGYYALRSHAAEEARELAQAVTRELRTEKLVTRDRVLAALSRVRAHELQFEAAHARLVSSPAQNAQHGIRLEPVSPRHLGPVVWGSAPCIISGNATFVAEVALSTLGLRNKTIWLAVIFTALGLLLSTMVYQIPLRTLSRAEGRIQSLVDRLTDSQTALSKLNQNLEAEVKERSKQLTAAYETLQTRETRLRELSTRAVALQEDERRGIARDLHDAVGQLLTAVRIDVQLLSERMGLTSPDPRMVSIAERALIAIDSAVDETRRAIARLGPSILDEVGLEQALDRLCDDFTERTGIQVNRLVSMRNTKLPLPVEITCYRVTQETMTNVAKHARATHVQLSLETDEERFTLMIADDGSGFDPSTDASNTGRGINGIRERVELLDGELSISSTFGQGTSVVVSLPLHA